MKLIYITSPFAGDIEHNTKMGIEYCRYAADNGVVPIASHLLFPLFLNDSNPAEREQGIKMRSQLLASCDAVWVFGDRISEGMRREIEEAEKFGIPVNYQNWSEEMCRLNSRENFEDNKRFLKTRIEQENSPIICRLLETDLRFLDRIQVQMATAREFLIIIRLIDEKKKEIFSYLNRIEKTLREQSFSVKRAEKEDIKRILAVYFEQNATSEKFENFDGERWIILND